MVEMRATLKNARLQYISKNLCCLYRNKSEMSSDPLITFYTFFFICVFLFLCFLTEGDEKYHKGTSNRRSQVSKL